MSKPTMQDIADTLSTSRISVWKALNNRSGVSKELREKVIMQAEEMGYFKKTELTSETIIEPSARTIAAVVARPESSVFWMQIIHQLAKELGRQGYNMMYTYLPTYYKDGYKLPPALQDGSVAGAIMLNAYSEPILRMLAALPIPKVFLDTMPSVPPSQLKGDLVLLEGRYLIKQITTRLLQSGRPTLGFVGDIDYAQTNMDRYHGFLDAHQELGLQPNPAFSMTGHLGLSTHYQEISNFLDSLPSLPDGFVCASDYIAHFIQRYFSNKNPAAAKKIVLTGFDNNIEYSNIANNITTVNVQTETLGSRLADKILFSINHPKAPHEVSYITSDILYRGALNG